MQKQQTGCNFICIVHECSAHQTGFNFVIFVHECRAQQTGSNFVIFVHECRAQQTGSNFVIFVHECRAQQTGSNFVILYMNAGHGRLVPAGSHSIWRNTAEMFCHRNRQLGENGLLFRFLKRRAFTMIFNTT